MALKQITQDKDLLNPVGLGKLMLMITDRLIVRKKVALWDDFDSAAIDLLTEIKQGQPDDICEGIDKGFYLMMQHTYLKEWYNKL